MVSINDMLLIISTIVLLHQQNHNELAKRKDFDSEYDFVVVGAGTSGSVVATRLAEAGHRVLLLEAGGQVPVVSEIPALAKSIDKTFQWGYETVPQKFAAQAYKQHQVPLVRAKVLGGGSVENSLNYNRGKVHDYDDWNKEFGLTNWTYNKMLRFILMSEDKTLNWNFIRRNLGIHAIGGPIKVSVSKSDYTFEQIFKTINESGYPIIDANDMKGIGLSKMLTNTNNGSRWSSENGYLQPNINNTNLDILAFARVTKLYVEEKHKKKLVKSVEFLRNNEKHTVKARKEVILCGGVFGSAQLLMLSGIGPKEHLKNIGIKSLVDLPVGDNLHDHPAFALTFKYLKPLPERKTLENIYHFFANGTGPLTTLVPIVLNIRTNVTKDLPKNQPDFEIDVQSVKLSVVNYADKESWTNYLSECLDNLCLSVGGKVMYPKSRGKFRLKSKDPFEQPLIDPNYVSQPNDLDVFIAGFKEIFRIFTSHRFQNIATYLGTIPGCNSCPGGGFDCDEYLKCLVRQLTGTFGHPLGTCRIGNPNDARRVVEENFKIRSFDNLRVINASVIPKIPGGHLNVIALAIGEMGADIVLREYS